MRQIHLFLHEIKKIVIQSYIRIISVFVPIEHKKVFFISFLGKSYSDNPRAISEKLHEMYPDYKIVWAFENPKQKRNIVPSYIKIVKAGSAKALFEQTTSGVWIDNYLKSAYSIKREGQLYIQTWHGDRPIKKVLFDAHESKDVTMFESNNIDLAIAGSLFGVTRYRSAFKYFGNVLCEGSPRNDILIKGSVKDVKSFRSQYGIPNNKKLLLYAPTFRDNIKGSVQHISGLDFTEILQIFKDKTGSDWMLLLRGHTGRKLVLEDQSSDNIIDISDYEDSRFILLSSDAIISDYSSMATDFILTGKPTFLYINDYKEYTQINRSLWFDLKKTPFLCAETQEELLKIIKETDFNKSDKNCKAILSMFETIETGQSSEKVCEWIASHSNKIK